MAGMDSLIAQLIQQTGSANTPDNMNRIREFYASDPKALENRIYGTRSPSDESGGSRDAILNGMLDKAIAADMPASVEATTVPQQDKTQAVKAPQRAAAPQRPDVPGDPQPLPRDNVVNPLDNVKSGNAGGNGGGGSFFDSLLPLLIGGAATFGPMLRNGKDGVVNNDMVRGPSAASENPYTRAITGPDANAPQLTAHPRTIAPAPYSTDLEQPKPSEVKGSPAVPVTQQSPADVARMKAEVDQENAAAARLQEQMAEKALAQRNTAKTLQNAKRVFTGR